MQERLAVLDGARGVAVLGILLLNIISFGLPQAAYLNPAFAGLPSATDTWVWATQSLFAEQKFLTIFALLFGAGLQLQLRRGKGNEFMKSRLSWLLLFGLLHTLFLWDGDILLSYGLVGLMCWRMIRDAQSPRSLLRFGLVLYSLGLLLLLTLGWLSLNAAPSTFWQPDWLTLDSEITTKLNGGWGAVTYRFHQMISMLLVVMLQYGWQLAGLMVAGAGLIRNGWLQGSRLPHQYWRKAIVLISLGLLIQSPSVWANIAVKWDFHWSAYFGQIPREIAAPIQAMGYLALWYAIFPHIQHSRFAQAMVSVGRMALSNYILQTLLCSLIFYHFGWFNQLDRVHLLMIVPVIWLINILFSVIWLRHFSQGPLEWVWRKLVLLSVRHHHPA
ncbi:DUF418 domain-containing protein YeiB [Plesiomonas sp.]|uniref:DUF418 domain-containing protein YeiB n=1 Tax=Plesiomonas sp. TaxID=2486279 RepID=UPI003EE7862D